MLLGDALKVAALVFSEETIRDSLRPIRFSSGEESTDVPDGVSEDFSVLHAFRNPLWKFPNYAALFCVPVLRTQSCKDAIMYLEDMFSVECRYTA
jgi:hypothetical protein